MPPAPLRKPFIHPVKMDSGRDFQVKTYTCLVARRYWGFPFAGLSQTGSSLRVPDRPKKVYVTKKSIYLRYTFFLTCLVGKKYTCFLTCAFVRRTSPPD